MIRYSVPKPNHLRLYYTRLCTTPYAVHQSRQPTYPERSSHVDRLCNIHRRAYSHSLECDTIPYKYADLCFPTSHQHTTHISLSESRHFFSSHTVENTRKIFFFPSVPLVLLVWRKNFVPHIQKIPSCRNCASVLIHARKITLADGIACENFS